MQFPPEARAELEALAARGTLVYVMRSAGVLNYLYFNWVFARLGLPLARAVLGLSRRIYRPLAALFLRRSFAGTDEVLRAVEEGDAAMVFLRRPSVLRSQGTATDDPFERLVALQRRSERPIFLVPQLLVFKRAPVRLRPGVADVILGSAEVPGRLHAFVSFLFNYRRAFVKIGKPIELGEVIANEEGSSDALIARKVRGSLAVGLARELRLVVGPPLKDHERFLDEVLRDRTLRAELSELARESGRPEEELLRQSRKNLGEIAARYSPATVDALNAIARWVFQRLYDGIHVDEEGLARAMDAARRAPLVLCPTHRSHVDYLLVSHVLIERGMMPPFVAAGANLSFFPLGPLFRRSCAFFIRRSFKGDQIYAAVLTAYVRRLARDGYTQEFYPEGGRTRTGRILQPKYGLIAMEVDAWLGGARDDLHFVPIAIDYAKLIEADTYAREAAGGEKRKEDLTGLLRAPAVLRSRWGEVHMQLDAPISLAKFAAERGFPGQQADGEARKTLVRALAHRIAYGMGRVQTITPTALAAAGLLGHRRRGIPADELRRAFETLLHVARARGARFSDVLRTVSPDPIEPGPIHEALLGFSEDKKLAIEEVDGKTIFLVADEARPALSIYKNNLVHHFQEEAVLAAALLAAPGGRAPEGQLLPRVELISRLLKLELSFRSDVPLRENVGRTANMLESLGAATVRDGVYEVIPEGREVLVFLRDLIGDVVESYLVAIAALDPLERGPLERKELVRKFLEHGRAQYLAGQILAIEAISKPTFETALDWLEDQGFVELLPTGRFTLTGPWRRREVRAGFHAEISRFLQR